MYEIYTPISLKKGLKKLKQREKELELPRNAHLCSKKKTKIYVALENDDFLTDESMFAV